MTENNINTGNQAVAAEQLTQGKGRTFAVTLQRRKLSILIVTVVFIAAAILYISRAVPTYTSTARLYVEQTGPRIITEYEGIMTQSKNYLYTQGELVRSTPILAQVVQRSDIKKLETLKKKPTTIAEEIKNRIGLAEPIIEVGEIDNLVVYLKKIIDVKIGIKDDIIAVSCESNYREEAAQIVNAIVESYVNYQTSQKKSTVSEVLRILQKEKIERDKELAGNFEELLNFTRQYGVVSFERSNENAVFQRLKTLSVSLAEAQLSAINAKAEFEAVQKLAEDPLKIKQYAMTQLNTNQGLFEGDSEKRLRIELDGSKTELESALLQCSDDHPTVKALKSKIADIERQLALQLNNQAKAYIEVLDIKYQTAKQREDELMASYKQEEKAAQDLNVKATEYAVIESKLERSKRFCEILDERIKELNVSEDTGALNVNILEAARPAELATSPKRAKIVAVSLILGILFGIGFAVIRELMDWRLRSTDEISAILAVPVLGIVPSMGGKGKKAVTDHGQKVHLEPKSSVAEAYRTIRTAVFFSVPKGQARTILVTSPAPNDGKTTMVSNLAIAMAQAGQKTLVVDADFRKPMQHNVFAFTNETEKGLSSVLAGQISLDEAIRHCPTEGLDLLTSGPDVPNPSELLNSEAFANLLKELTHRYDRIVIDSPPITPVADSQILAAICDATILVLRAEKSTKKAAQQAKEALVGVGAHVLGAIVNDVSPRHSRYGYYSHYGYYGYGYGYGKKNK
ncbi:MAG: polysaccharide biosynthesis tyrosine autokinase [Phycisphaerae bacterium]|nr:polysaccharide biosynthesis tyrosine autokinase [Phycisphaerae bacterium]